MPLFEYRCLKCGHEFEELVFGDSQPECPACHSAEVEKRLSCPCRYVSGGGGGVNPEAFAKAAASGCGGGCAGCAGGNCASCGH